jgi:hypothetical protein
MAVGTGCACLLVTKGATTTPCRMTRAAPQVMSVIEASQPLSRKIGSRRPSILVQRGRPLHDTCPIWVAWWHRPAIVHLLPSGASCSPYAIP